VSGYWMSGNQLEQWKARHDALKAENVLLRAELAMALREARDLCHQAYMEICKHPVSNTPLYLALRAVRDNAAPEKDGAA
jgi:hypothetical protein